MARDGITENRRMPHDCLAPGDRNHSRLCNRSHSKCSLVGETCCIGYERFWGTEQPKARSNRPHPLLRVPRSCDAWFPFAQGGRSGARLGKQGRFHPDRDLPDRRIDSGMAGHDFSLLARADLFRVVHLQRNLRVAAHGFWRRINPGRAIHESNPAELRSGGRNPDLSFILAPRFRARPPRIGYPPKRMPPGSDSRAAR